MLHNDTYELDEIVIDNIRQKIANFKQLPYLFVGSGFTKRYCPDSPNWDELLRNARNVVHPDSDDAEFLMLKRRIENKIKESISYDSDQDYIYYVNPMLASDIEKDFNDKFYNEISFSKQVFSEESILDILKNGYNPFKFFIAESIKHIQYDETVHPEEILSINMNYEKIAGVITTNYDCLLEEIFDNFEVSVGQDNLLLSNTFNLFQIFKIHGSCNEPDSIVLTKKDYDYFENKLKYLSAKLLTIFVENPVIFIGYSISDLNIRNILREIADCLNKEQLKALADNLIFITRSKNGKNLIRRRDIEFNNKRIEMTEFVLSDYTVLYDSLSEIKSSIPVKVTRMLQNMISDYVYSNKATNKIMFGDINSPNIDDSQVAIYIGKTADVTEFGFKAYTIEEILEDVLRDNNPQMLDSRLITYTFPLVRRSAGSTLLPVYKYLKHLNVLIDEIPQNFHIIRSLDDECIALNTNDRKYIKPFKDYEFTSIADIEFTYTGHLYRQTSFIKYFIHQVDVDELREYLNKHFDDVFFGNKNKYKSVFKKLIAIYDFLKYS